MSTAARYRLTDKGMEDALKLVEGATPSELGYSFLKATIALAVLEPHLKGALGQLKDKEADLEDALAKTRELEQVYAEAARLVEPEQE